MNNALIDRRKPTVLTALRRCDLTRLGGLTNQGIRDAGVEEDSVTSSHVTALQRSNDRKRKSPQFVGTSRPRVALLIGNKQALFQVLAHAVRIELAAVHGFCALRPP